MLKLKWRVQPAPTGRYRSFETRGWPNAEYENGNAAAMILCDKSYYPCDVKTGNHPELKLCVADWSVDPWKWRTLTKRAKTLKEAKEVITAFLERNPEFRGEN